MDPNNTTQPTQSLTPEIKITEQPEKNASSGISILVKIVLGILWIPLALIILFVTSYISYSSNFFWIFYAKALIAILVINTIIFAPYLLMFRKNSGKWAFVVLIFGLSIFYMLTSKISYFFPPMPVYEGGQNVKYSNESSSLGELASNNIFMRFEMPNGSNAQTRKNVANFYKQVFASRGYELRGSLYSPIECADYIEEQSFQGEGDNLSSCAIVDSMNHLQLELGFYGNIVSIVKR